MLPRLLFAMLILAATSAAIAQEVAGRVLVAAGDVTIERGAQKIRAQRGSEVRTGDLFVLGEKSNAQIRLTDESIIALASNTTFKLTEYAFQKRESKLQRAFFDLLRGGLRTVTGLIGRRQRDTYAVRTPTATVGIRGTHYALRYCNDDCYEGGSGSASAEPVKLAAGAGADIGPIAQAGGAGGSGALAPNGTYGAVTDGRIGVTNQTGETVFGSDQYFFVASQATAPQQLIAPPPFLRDTLEGRAAAQKPAAETPGQASTASDGGESAGTVAPTGPGGGTGDVGVSASTTTSTVPPQLQINPFVVTEAAVAAGELGTIASLPGDGIVIFRTVGGVLSGVCASGPPCELYVAEIRFGINLATQSAQGRINVVDLEDGGAFNLSTSLDFSLPVVSSNGVLSFSGTLTPNAGGVLRCEACDGGDVGQLQSLTLSGIVSGGNLSLTFTGVQPDGDAGTFSAVLPQVPLPTTPLAAIAYPALETTNPNRVTQSSGFNNAIDSSGLVHYGWFIGGPQGNRGSANSTIVGSDASAGNLVWGRWDPGALIVDENYNVFQSAGRVDWIYGDPAFVPNVAGLGTVTYTPVGWSLNGGGGTLNSASLTANFTTRQIDFSVNATNTSFGNTFQLSGTTQYGVATTRFQGSLAGTCNGTSCGTNAPSSGGFAGFIAGSAGQGAGVAMSAGATGQPGQGVSGVIGFKR